MFRRENAAYALRFNEGDLQMRPKTDILILTCMDSRVDPAHFLSLDNGTAFVYRNAGGRVTDDLLRSALLSQVLGCRRIMVIHHTDCGLNRFTNGALRERVEKELELDASHIDFLPYVDLEQSVRDDVSLLRKAAAIRNEVSITGHIYDVKNGRMSDVRII